MRKIITLELSKNNQIIEKYSNINALYKDDTYTFKLDNALTTINKDIFIRDNNEYHFELNIKNKTGMYTYKTINTKYDIDVYSIKYIKEDNKIILTYKISTDEDEFKIIIKEQ